MRKNLLKRGVSIGLSVTMIGSSTATWAENLESSSAEQETVTQELNLQSEDESQEENVEEVAEASVQTETVPAVSEVIEYPEETSVYPQEVLTTAKAEVLPEEVVTESTATETESENLEKPTESTEAQASVEITEVSTEQEKQETEIESELGSEAESELASESEPETQTQEFESFDEAETEGYLAETLVEGNFQYQVSNNKATIVGYIGTESIVTIPATIGEYFVTAIGVQAFYQNQTITKINLPEGLTTIGSRAFAESSLTSIIIPGTITTVEDGAFSKSQLVSATFEEGDEYTKSALGSGIFENCEKLESIKLSENIVSIGSRLIYGTRVTSITIPQNVIKGTRDDWGVGTLRGCEYLKEIIFESGMKTIPAYIAANAENP